MQILGAAHGLLVEVVEAVRLGSPQFLAHLGGDVEADGDADKGAEDPKSPGGVAQRQLTSTASYQLRPLVTMAAIEPVVGSG